MNFSLDSIGTVLTSIGIYPLFAFVLAVGLYLFWRETRFSRKNRNSVFDMFFFSFVILVVWGRLSYIIANFVEFESLPWFVFPYERYADGFYLFRLLPWRYFRIWDGGFLFTGVFVSFVLGAFLYSNFVKKWRWKDMMGAVYSSAISMLAMTLYFYGFFSTTNIIISQGLRLMFLSGLYFFATVILLRFKEKIERIYNKVYVALLSVFVAISSWYIYVIFTGSESTYVDRMNIYVYLCLAVVSLVYYLIDSFRVEVKIETITNIKAPISITTNQPVRIKGGLDSEK